MGMFEKKTRTKKIELKDEFIIWMDVFLMGGILYYYIHKELMVYLYIMGVDSKQKNVNGKCSAKVYIIPRKIQRKKKLSHHNNIMNTKLLISFIYQLFIYIVYLL